MKITLKDGSVKEYGQSMAVIDVARDLSEGLARVATCAKVDGEVKDLRTVLDKDCELEILTFDSEEGKGAFNHTASHMAVAYFKEKEEPYKVELVEDLPEGEEISFYSQGEFTDLCAGPHLMSTKAVKAFKLTSLAGAYWRGDEKNKMLTRIYGVAYPKKSELDDYLHMMEEARKRDHRKLGRELGLFMMSDEGPGFPFFLPKGMELKNTLLDYWRKLHREKGYVEVSTPIILSRHLWENSGHWDHYKNNMYTTVIDEEDYAVKPMNCPGGMLVYKSEPRSYKDLPIRMGELGLVHRHEKSGQLHGLMRVRCFTQDDAHIFMTPEQIRDEIKGVAQLIDEVYSLFGFKYHVELSTRPEDSMGSDEDWEMATEGLRGALDDMGLDYIVNEGDGWTTWGLTILLTKETAPSTGRRLTSTWRTPLEEPGSAGPSSWICRCLSGLTWSTQEQTERNIVRS